MYGGMTCLDYLVSFIRLQDLCRERNITIAHDFIANESLITRARNTLVENFLKSDSDVLVFIDSDIGFDPRQILDCVESEFPVCGISYPLKGYSEDMMMRKIRTDYGKIPDKNFANELLQASLPANVNLLLERDGDSVRINCNISKGFMEVAKIGTGLMCIKRQALESLVEKYPETYRNDVGGYENGEYHMLFDTMVEPDSKRYLSEDYAFCYKWRQHGGKVWVHLGSVAFHTGYHRFRGSLIDSVPLELRNYLIENFSKAKEDDAPKFTKRKKDKEPVEEVDE